MTKRFNRMSLAEVAEMLVDAQVIENTRSIGINNLGTIFAAGEIVASLHHADLPYYDRKEVRQFVSDSRIA